MVGTRSWFEAFAERTAKAAGSKYAFALAVTIVLVWAACGPHFDYSDSWSLVINTLTTIITFWMVFLIQNTTNRETKALSVKIDELIRADKNASNTIIALEERTETEIMEAAAQIKRDVQ